MTVSTVTLGFFSNPLLGPQRPRLDADGGRLELSARALIAGNGGPAVGLAASDNATGMTAECAIRHVQPFVTTEVGQLFVRMDWWRWVLLRDSLAAD